MPKNTDKDSSKLVLSNGNSISIGDCEMITTSNDGITISDNSVTDATGVLVAGRGMGKSYSNNFTIPTVDYQERFEEERERLAHISKAGMGVNVEDLYILVLLGNKAVWQESKDGD